MNLVILVLFPALIRAGDMILKRRANKITITSVVSARNHLLRKHVQLLRKAILVDLPLASNDSMSYYGTVKVGTPGRSFSVLLDTGSSDFWIPSSQCLSPACQGRQNRLFDSTKSSTFVPDGTKFWLQYGSGQVGGIVGIDTINAADLVANNQRFGLVNNEPDDSFSDQPFDGIMGLGFPALAQINSNPITTNLLSVFSSRSQIVSFLMTETGGVASFGSYNPNLFAGSLTWLKVTLPSYWQVVLNSVNVGNHGFSGEKRAILDTGTSLFAIPTTTCDQINQIFDAYEVDSGIYAVDCSSVNSLPIVTITLDGNPFDLDPTDYIIQAGSQCISVFTPVDMDNDEGLPMWILGDPFLRRYYSVYDYGNQLVGLAPAINTES